MRWIPFLATIKVLWSDGREAGGERGRSPLYVVCGGGAEEAGIVRDIHGLSFNILLINMELCDDAT